MGRIYDLHCVNVRYVKQGVTSVISPMLTEIQIEPGLEARMPALLKLCDGTTDMQPAPYSYSALLVNELHA